MDEKTGRTVKCILVGDFLGELNKSVGDGTFSFQDVADADKTESEEE